MGWFSKLFSRSKPQVPSPVAIPPVDLAVAHELIMLAERLQDSVAKLGTPDVGAFAWSEDDKQSLVRLAGGMGERTQRLAKEAAYEMHEMERSCANGKVPLLSDARAEFFAHRSRAHLVLDEMMETVRSQARS